MPWARHPADVVWTSWRLPVTQSGWTLVFSFVATVVSAVTFAKAFWRDLPTAEFLVERDQSGRLLYKLSLSNPTHRLLVLDQLTVPLPRAEGVVVRRMNDTAHGAMELAYEDVFVSRSKERKSVYLPVPAGETEYLEIEFRDFSDDDDFEVHFRVCWSKGVPVPERWFIVRAVKLDSAQVKSRKLAAVPRAA